MRSFPILESERETEREMLCHLYADLVEMRMTICHDILMIEIWKYVSISSLKTLSSLVEAYKEIELELETPKWKRRQDQVHANATITKKARAAGFWEGNRETRRLCGKCGKIY